MSADEQAQWERIVSYFVGFQATWIADIGLKSRLFQAIADAGDAVTVISAGPDPDTDTSAPTAG